jgi:hypothetical protein
MRRSRENTLDPGSSGFPQEAQQWESMTRRIPARTLRPVAERNIYLRKLAYPIITLCVAGVIYLYSRGKVALEAPAAPEQYIALAREVVDGARATGRVPRAVSPTIDALWPSMAPERVRSREGGALSFEHTGLVDPSASLPWVQAVIVRAPDGSGVSLSLSITDGRREVVGLAKIEPRAAGAEESR